MALRNYEFSVYWNPSVFLLLLKSWDGYSCGLETSAFVHTSADVHTCLSCKAIWYESKLTSQQ